ncbi:MAG: AAA family ATPase [bacterium]
MLASASEFVGQQRARALIARYVERGRLSGTFLLLGQRGLGKTTLATLIARALCCTGAKRGSEALAFCGDCYACRTIAAGEQPEYVTVRPRGQDISVKQLDEDHGGLATALYKPNLLSHRIFLIDNAHHLNEESGNRLLKLFEEAPAQTVFLLTTDRPELLLPTIHSRGQKITLSPLATAELSAALSARGVEGPAAAEAALMGGGRFVDSLALSGNQAWRAALSNLGEAILRRSGVPEAAADAAGYEHALLWEKEQADHGMEEAELEKLLPKARQNELLRQALISAYDRSSWWLLQTGLPSGLRDQGPGTGDRRSGTGDQGPGTGDQHQLHDSGSRTSRVADGATRRDDFAPQRQPREPMGERENRTGAGMSNRPAAADGIINMDDWEDGARGSGLGDPQRPQSDPRSAETRNRTPDTRSSRTSDGATRRDEFAPQRSSGPARRDLHEPARGIGPWGDPQYMNKLATLRKRISGNVDRELAQIAFEASL